MPAYASGGYYRPGDPLENIRDEVARQRARGFADYKMKVGGLPLAEDEARVAAAREALGPTGRLALDANNAYASVAEAMKAADAFAPHDIWWFEEPLVPDDVDGHAQLAARGPIPIATGEIEATAWGFGHLLRARAAHIHQTDACVCGGVGEWMKAAHAAAAFGVQVAPHWHHNLHAQLAAAVSNGLVVEHFALEEGVYNFEELLDPATRIAVADGAVAALRSPRHRLPLRPGCGRPLHARRRMKGVAKLAPGPGHVGLRRAPGGRRRAGRGRARAARRRHLRHRPAHRGRRVPERAAVTMGHELCGVVAELGAGVDAAWAGARVTSETFFSTCGTCRWCRSGRPSICPQRRSVGTHVDGAFAPRVRMPGATSTACPPR